MEEGRSPSCGGREKERRRPSLQPLGCAKGTGLQPLGCAKGMEKPYASPSLWWKDGALPVEVGRRKGEALPFNRSAVRREQRSSTLRPFCGGRAEPFLSCPEEEGRSPPVPINKPRVFRFSEEQLYLYCCSAKLIYSFPLAFIGLATTENLWSPPPTSASP